MKRILAGALALSLIAGSAAMADPYDRRGPDRGSDRGSDHGSDRGRDRYDHPQQARHHWQRGERLPANYRTRSYYIDYRAHHLRRPPRGYQWVRADDNYALVALTSGLISEIIAANR